MLTSIFKWIGIGTVFLLVVFSCIFLFSKAYSPSSQSFSTSFRESFITSCSNKNSSMKRVCTCFLDEMITANVVKNDVSDILAASRIQEYKESPEGKEMIARCIKQSLAKVSKDTKSDSVFYAFSGCRSNLKGGKKLEMAVTTEVTGSRDECKKVESEKRQLLISGGFKCDEVKEEESCQSEGPFAEWVKEARKKTRLGYTYLVSKDLANRDTVNVFFNKGPGSLAICEYFNSQIAQAGITGSCVEGL